MSCEKSLSIEIKSGLVLLLLPYEHREKETTYLHGDGRRTNENKKDVQEGSNVPDKSGIEKELWQEVKEKRVIRDDEIKEPKLDDFGLNGEHISRLNAYNDLECNIRSTISILPFWVLIVGLLILFSWLLFKEFTWNQVDLEFIIFEGIERLIYVGIGVAITSRILLFLSPILHLFHNQINFFEMIITKAIAWLIKSIKFSKETKILISKQNVSYNQYLSNLEQYKTHLAKIKQAKEQKERKTRMEALRKEKEEKMKKEEYWFSLSGAQFEKEIAHLFKIQGFETTITQYVGDGGIDIFLERGEETTVVQCKNHKNQVGPGVVRELFGVMHASDATNAILVCSGGFTSGVFDFAKNKPIKLVDINGIIKMANYSKKKQNAFSKAGVDLEDHKPKMKETTKKKRQEREKRRAKINQEIQAEIKRLRALKKK